MMALLDNNWIIWPVGISLWIALGWGLFAWRETLGIRHDDTAGYVTLSYFVWRVSQAWGPFQFVLGFAVGLFWGALAVHFWWHWCPPGSVSVGWLGGLRWTVADMIQ